MITVPAPHSGQLLACALDALVSGVHFPAATSPRDVIYKAVAVNLSDLAAMGAEPLGAQCQIESGDDDRSWRTAVAAAGIEAGTSLGVDVALQESSGRERRVCVQVLGQVPRGQALTRSGARPGDQLWVSGTAGDAAAGLAALSGGIEATDDFEYLRARLDRPTPRLALGRALRDVATAAIDVSDGIAGDAAHVARASGLALRISLERLPLSPSLQRATDLASARRWAAFGGDDYELLFTAPASAQAAVRRAADISGTPVTVIGEALSGAGVTVHDVDGHAVEGAAFEHFHAEPSR